MARPLAPPPTTAMLHRLTVHAAQSIKLGMPPTAALKYELHHRIYPFLMSTANACAERRPGEPRTPLDFKMVLNDPRTKARFMSALLSAIGINLLVYHDISLDASDCDDVLIEELGGAGEAILREAMVRALATSFQNVGGEFFSAQEIDLLRTRQAALVKALNERGKTAQAFFQKLAEVEALVGEFWQIEGQIDELMHGEADRRFWP
jgi:hypothetical protein